jgi:diguanylate cyclase (GGDEF)-like protein
MHCKDGRWKWVLGRGKVVRRSADNRPLRLIGTITDISLRKAAEEEVRHMAFHDTLTGLPNRAALDVHLDKAMARAQRHKKMLAVCLLDLDDFKPVNDTHGHAAGDLLLRSLAARLQAFTRKSDFLARLGGDEFVLLVEDLGSETDIHMVLDNVQQAVGMPFVLSGQTTVEISASMGVCLYDPSQTGELIAGDILLRRADLALYQSKERGPGRDRIWRIYENASKVRPRVRDLLSAGRLRVFYQPVMDSRGRRIAGAEALARLEDTDGNILPPAEFLPQFTKQDLTSLWKDVLSRVLGDVKSLQQQGLTLGTVSVNMDPSSFCGECVDVLRAAFAHSDVPPSKITLEILESSDFLVPKPETLRVMQEIKALGVHLAMDDVGSAYSSLQRLWELPIDAIKLASNLVRTLPDSPQDLHFVLALRDLARGLGVRLIVAGVETAEILDAMMVLDVPLLQGHAIAAPMPLARLEEWLRHAPKWQDEHPNSPLGIYAYQMAQLDTLQTMIAYDPSLPEKLEMKDPRKCPVQRYLRRLGFGEGSEIDRLHQEYHHAFMDFGAMLASSSPMDEWQEIVRAHEALQQALVRAWKTVDGPQVRPFHLQVVKR